MKNNCFKIIIAIIFLTISTKHTFSKNNNSHLSVIARSVYKNDGGRVETITSIDSKTITENVFDNKDKKLGKIVYEKDASNKIRIARIFKIKKQKEYFHRYVEFGYNKIGKKSEERMYEKKDNKKILVHWVIFTYSGNKQREPTLVYLLNNDGSVALDKRKLLLSKNKGKRKAKK